MLYVNVFFGFKLLKPTHSKPLNHHCSCDIHGGLCLTNNQGSVLVVSPGGNLCGLTPEGRPHERTFGHKAQGLLFLAIPCGRCKGAWGHVAMYSGGLLSIKFCPYCGVDIDTDI
jgi:hypothetical protein